MSLTCTMLSYVIPKNEGYSGAELQEGIESVGVRKGELDSIEASPIVRHGSTDIPVY